MKIVEFLRPEFILEDLRATDKASALSELCRKVRERDPSLPSAERLYEVLEEREQLRSTGIGDHVAIPHGRLPGLPRLIGAYARSVRGIDFVGTDDNPGTFHHFIVLFAPENCAGLHLKALARITRLFRNASLRDGLLAQPDPAAMYQLIAAEDALHDRTAGK